MIVYLYIMPFYKHLSRDAILKQLAKSLLRQSMSKELPKSINLLDPVNPPEDVWSKMYDWVFKVGRYLLVFVQLIVLSVFFARFVLDQQNNDLTEEINDKVNILSTESLRKDELRYRNVHMILSDIRKLKENQVLNSQEVSSVLDGFSKDLSLVSFSFSNGRVNLQLISEDFEKIKVYENSLKSNPKYTDVGLTLVKSGDEDANIEFSVSFSLADR